MNPPHALFGRLTWRGRMHGKLAAALAEPDPAAALRRLRTLWPRLAQKPAAAAGLWLPLLDKVLRGPVAYLLTADDLSALETTGAQIAEDPGGGLRLADALRPLLPARDARREPQAACALLTRIYQAPSSTGPEKITIARTLAARGARGDAHLAVYVDHLSRVRHVTLEPNMRTVLAESLAVGFEVGTIRIKRAAELARQLRAARITMTGLDLAMGYACLLVDRQPAEAAEHLFAAHRANPADPTAFTGLLSAWLRAGDHVRIAELAGKAGRPVSPAIDGLIELSATLAWLDGLVADRPRSASAARLAGLGVAAQAGEWLGYAAGRLRLIDGDARGAAEILIPLADQHPDHPQWNYHAAWAQLLAGDPMGVAQRFHAARAWSGRWAIGCLSLDADPNLVGTITAELAEYRTPVVAVRVALAEHRPAPEWTWRPGGGTAEEELESFRTMVGRHLVERNQVVAAEALTWPAAFRLPLADRLWWCGIAALPAEPDRGRTLLERAHELGHPRAALALAVHHFEQSRRDEANRLLARFAWRTDPALELLRTWASACAGDDDATGRIEELAAQRDSRAQYALGSVYLTRAAEAADKPDRRNLFIQQASAQFRAAVGDGAASVPHDAEALAYFTGLAGAEPAAGDARRPPVPDGPRQRAWMGWLDAILRLADDPGTVPVAACSQLVHAIEAAEHPHPDVLTTVSCGLFQSCSVTGDRDRAVRITALLGRLAGRTPDSPVRRRHDLAAALVARRWPDQESPSPNGTMSSALVLVRAEHALEDGDRPAAAGYLRTVPATGEPEHRISRLVADLLDGLVDVPTTTPAQSGGPAGLALRVLHAAAVTEQDPERCLDLLLPAMREHDLTGIVDLRASLPRLCAGAGRRRSATGAAELVRMLAPILDSAVDPLLPARCACAVGEHELAGTLWRRVFSGQADAPAPVREEYAGFLRHRAVVARRAGRDLDAAHYLRLATRVSEGCRLDRTTPTEEEITALNHQFKIVIRGIGGTARKKTQRQWDDLYEGLGDAGSRRDEVAAITYFTRLQRILATTANGTLP